MWNHENRRLVRFWCARAGLDESVIDGLRSRRFGALDIAEPSAEQLRDQLRVELPVSRRHLRAVLEGYWDRDSRPEHKGYDESPEDHLWRAANAVSEIQDALDEFAP